MQQKNPFKIDMTTALTILSVLFIVVTIMSPRQALSYATQKADPIGQQIKETASCLHYVSEHSLKILHRPRGTERERLKRDTNQLIIDEMKKEGCAFVEIHTPTTTFTYVGVGDPFELIEKETNLL